MKTRNKAIIGLEHTHSRASGLEDTYDAIG